MQELPNTHEGMAASLLNLLTTSNVQIPLAAVDQYIEIRSWLSAIAEGTLTVTETPKDGTDS